jgi:glycosyltransferase involved in cell wall biosynthesis
MIAVSVIIPTFNRLWCLPRAIESCRGSRCRIEIIVVDDGSTDGTWDWLSTQPDLVVLRQPNQGQTWAINQGIARSQGRYIRFLDSDDFLAPGVIDLQFETALKTGATVVYSRVDLYNETTKKISIQGETPQWDDFIAVMLGEGNGSHFLGMQFARELIEQAPRRPEFALREDRMFLLEVALQNPRIHPTPGCAGYWVSHGSQMHTNYSGIRLTIAAWQHLTLYQRILERLKQRDELTPRRARAAAGVLWPVIHALARTHLNEASRLAHWLATELCPGFRPPESPLVARLYNVLGYKNTQRLLRLRRTLLRRDPFGV